MDIANLSTQLTRLTAAAAPKLVAVHSHRALSSGFIWRENLIVTADEARAGTPPRISRSCVSTAPCPAR
jgi:hypothetical protein